MQTASAIALSGMRAAQTTLGVAAHNIADLATQGFDRQTVSSAQAPSGGVETAVLRTAQFGSMLERDLVDQLRAKSDFIANLAVFRTADAMTGALLDIRV